MGHYMAFQCTGNVQIRVNIYLLTYFLFIVKISI